MSKVANLVLSLSQDIKSTKKWRHTPSMCFGVRWYLCDALAITINIHRVKSVYVMCYVRYHTTINWLMLIDSKPNGVYFFCKRLLLGQFSCASIECAITLAGRSSIYRLILHFLCIRFSSHFLHIFSSSINLQKIALDDSTLIVDH